eukprot:Phypoly_transcript_20775.p1 GENE.Phypoly_transcript_20775~~Phypoly_transcript_20775.p1  ORF type:complete len:139 (+),score=25.18 Phypoly_transcript_20775:223-639(+)
MPVAFRAVHNKEFLVYPQICQNSSGIKDFVSARASASGLPVVGWNSSFYIEEHDNDHVALRTCWANTYVAVHEGKVVLVEDTTPAKKPECIFHLDSAANGRVALRGHHGRYISLHHGNVEFKYEGHHDEIWFEKINTV